MLRIADLTFDSPFSLAPLAGYSDLPFRLLCKRYGACYCVSEMISCHGLTYRQEKTLEMLASTEEEQPVAFQLFGADPDIMADAAEILATFCPAMIDINMGCPAKKVTRKGAGAALMTTTGLAEQILTRVISRTSIPVTVKIRSGPDSGQINAVPFAQMAENAGVAAIAVHGRTWAQGFSGQCDRAVIAEVKQAISIPVIGNGDIISYRDGIQTMDETGCDGIMIGRGALGNPWIFTGEKKPDNISYILKGARQHLDLMEQFLPVNRMAGYVKNHISRYFKELPGSSKMRQKIFACETVKELRDTVLTETT
ncbi:MAG: tRNA dihydrouridine synthase DusB [Deltaproteobacteria bacterium]|nr:tRNA dihydrouridine synthase DusB [Deltaproteobacteria bacterium]